MCLFVIYMISRAVWKKSGQVNFLKDNQISKFEVQLVVFENLRVPICLKFHGEKFTWLLFNNIDAKIWLCFPLSRVYSSLLRPPAFASSPKSLGFPHKDLLQVVELFLWNNWVLALFFGRNSLYSSNQYTKGYHACNPRLSCELFRCFKLQENFFQSLGFLLFNTFVIAVFGSPRLPDL